MQGTKINNEMILRIMTGFMLIPLIIGSIVFSKLLLQSIIFVVSIGMLMEWYNMTHTDTKTLLLGILVIAVPMSSLLSLTFVDDDYIYTFLTYAVIIGATDIFAMFGGKLLGGPKLASKISPQKTWSGLFVGVIIACSMTYLITKLPSYYFPLIGAKFLLFSALLACMAQVSDLFISCFKRKFSAKDTGNLLPGHGGVLDRFDSLILTAPILLFVIV
jgi:phosphatidate cytidylyltransferase